MSHPNKHSKSRRRRKVGSAVRKAKRKARRGAY